MVPLLERQGTRFSVCVKWGASNNPLSRSAIRETLLGEAVSEEAPRPSAQQCTEGARPRSPTPSAHPNPADPLHPPGSLLHFGSLPAYFGAPRPPRLPATPSQLWGTCSDIRGSGSRPQPTGSGPELRRVRNPRLGLWRDVMSIRNGWSLELESRALSLRANPGSQSQAPTPAGAPRRKTMRPPGALRRAPAAPPASRLGPPKARRNESRSPRPSGHRLLHTSPPVVSEEERARRAAQEPGGEAGLETAARREAGSRTFFETGREEWGGGHTL